MSYFDDHRRMVKRIERLHGIEMAYAVQNIIIDYGLDGVLPTDDDNILQYIPEPIFGQIDRNQERRARGFKGDDLEVSRSIILLHRDHPEYSQNQIAKIVGKSKGKVNKTLQKYRNGGYDGVLDFDNEISTASDTDTSTNTGTSTVTDTGMTATVTEPVTGSGAADHPDKPKTNEQSITYEPALEITTEIIELVYALFQTGTKYEAISEQTGLKKKQIFDIIEDGKKHNYVAPKKRPAPPEYIPQYNGQLTTYVKKDFNIAPEDVDRFYHLFIDPKGEYKFDVSYVNTWFENEYKYKAS